MSIPFDVPRMLRHKAVTPSSFRNVILGCLSVIALLLPGCGGSSVGPVATVTVTPTISTIAVNRQQGFTAVATDTKGNVIAGQVFSWTSSAPTIANITQSGIATGVAPGSTQITATANNITSTAVMLTVTPIIASVTISPTTASIAVNGTQQFTAMAYDANGNLVTAPFTWQNSNASIASISTTGLVTGLSPGTVMITASSGNVSSPVATLTVTP